jgi:hypothetical protein
MGSEDARSGHTMIDLKVYSVELPKPIRHPGEDIRAAKAIFEDRFGEQNWVDVNLWMQFAREVMEYLGTKTFHETAQKLEIKIRRL